MRKLVVFSRDPAPTERLIALIGALTARAQRSDLPGLISLRKEYEATCNAVEIIARPPGLGMWQQVGHRARLWSGRSDRAAVELLAAAHAGIVLTGTSDVDEPADRALWRAASAGGISSHVVLDQRIGLARRFTDPDGRVTLPDWVYVADAGFVPELVGIGLPPERVRMVGDLHFERLMRLIAKLSESDLTSVRAAWGVPSGRRAILFVSEAGREMAALGLPSPYDELIEFEKLVEALEAGNHPAVSGVEPAELCLVIRPHPRDCAGKYDRYAGLRRSGILIVISSAGELEAVVKGADCVVGMNSSILHVAQASGYRAYSLTGHPLGTEPGATR